MIARYAFAVAAALAAMAAWSAMFMQKGVKHERARVEKIGTEVDARAKIARKKAESQPHESLARYCRDCSDK